MIAEALWHMYPGIVLGPRGEGDASIVDDGSGPYIAEWRKSEPQPTNDEIAHHYALYAKAQKLANVKTFARNLILSKFPEWKQANMTARAVEILSASGTNTTEWEELQNAWAWIKQVRTYSNELESAIVNGNSELDITSGWPEV